MVKLVSLSFLIPTYNDEATIERVIREAVAVGKLVAKTFDIVVVNDGSRDRTGFQLSKLSFKAPQSLALKIITHRVNQGYGRTIKELYCAGKGEWLFTIPGDYQVGARELEKILNSRDFFLSSSGLIPDQVGDGLRGSSSKTLDSRFSARGGPASGWRGNDKQESRPDMILGRRTHRVDPWNRLLASWVYNTLLRVLFGITLHDVNSVRLMRRAILKDIRLTSSSAFVDAELVIAALGKGFRVTEVPIAHRPRQGGGQGGGNQWRTVWETIGEMMRFKMTQLFQDVRTVVIARPFRRRGDLTSV